MYNGRLIGDDFYPFHPLEVDMEKLGDALMWYVIFLFSTVLHEAAHSWAAFKMGDSTAYEGGQVSLNPVPHVKRSPFGMVLVPLFTFFSAGWMMGWASAPYDPYWALKYPRRAGWMSLAGPGANLLLVLVSALLIHLGMILGVFMPPEVIHFSTVVSPTQPGFFASVATFLSVLFSLNLLLCCFNLLPFPPLDGSGALTLLLSEKTSGKYLQWISQPQLQFISFFVAWQLFNLIFDPVHTACLNLLYPGAGYHRL
jgi:Zn-dependent protease